MQDETETELPEPEDEATEPAVLYRRAKPTDAVAIFNLLKRQHKETPWVAPINDAKALLVIVQALRDGRVFLATVDGGKKLIGSVGIVWDEPWWSDEPEPQDLWWFVLPEYRSTTAAGVSLLRLVHAEVPTGALRMANISAGAERDDRMEALYARVAGLRRVGSIYMRDR